MIDKNPGEERERRVCFRLSDLIPMRSMIILSCWSLLLAGCADNKDQQSPSEPEVSDSITSSVPPDSLVGPTSVPDPFCQFDSVAFRERFGIGLVTLDYSGYPFPLFRNPEGTGDTIWVNIAPRSFYQISLSDSSLGAVDWFFIPTEYDGGAVAWRDSTHEGGIGIGWNQKAPTLWLVPDSTGDNRGRFFAHIWKNYLGRTVWLHPSRQPDNPLRSTPHDTAEIVPYPTDGYPLYSITKVEHPWIQVDHLLEKNGVYGSDKWSEPIGWMKWYCGDSQRVDFLNAYELEDVYVEE